MYSFMDGLPSGNREEVSEMQRSKSSIELGRVLQISNGLLSAIFGFFKISYAMMGMHGQSKRIKPLCH